MGWFPTPGVFEKVGRTERTWDIFSRLLKDRIIFIGWEIDDMAASYIIGQLLFLQLDNKEQDISIYINSPGGSVTAGLAIYDTMQYVSNDIQTCCLGQAASMAALLLAAGTPKKRFALPNSRIMLHQPWGGTRGTASDISIQAEEILRLRQKINQIMAKHTGKSMEAVEADSDRDYFLDAKAAQEYGLIDEIIAPKAQQQPAASMAGAGG